MIDFLRTTVILTVAVLLVFTLTVQARTMGPEDCREPNEIYNLCGSACPVTCGDILNLNPPKPCTHQCVIGCSCQQDYVRETEEPTSRCIEARECHSTA